MDFVIASFATFAPITLANVVSGSAIASTKETPSPLQTGMRHNPHRGSLGRQHPQKKAHPDTGMGIGHHMGDVSPSMMVDDSSLRQ